MSTPRRMEEKLTDRGLWQSRGRQRWGKEGSSEIIIIKNFNSKHDDV